MEHNYHQMPVGLRFSIIDRAFRHRLDELLREKELTGVQFGVLGALARLERSGVKEINQRDLENAAHVTHPTMTGIIRRLESKGFILCSPGVSDRRNKLISSTEKAEALREEMAEADESVFRWLSAGMSPEQLGHLTEIMDIMLDRINTCCRKGKNQE